MIRDKADRLNGLLKRLNAGENPEKVKREVKEFLSTISPLDLSIAEQDLLEAGLKMEDLRHLCSAHMEMMNSDFEHLKAELEPDHVIATLMAEHDQILGFLDGLDEVNRVIQNESIYQPSIEAYQNLSSIADHLVGAEPHHIREEEVLFPTIERHGVFGPTKVMVLEHQDMRRLKGEIKVLSEGAAGLDFNMFKTKLDEVSKKLIFMLRDHIMKENSILYPTAIQIIKDEKIWEAMKEECDVIGYCCFTPKCKNS